MRQGMAEESSTVQARRLGVKSKLPQRFVVHAQTTYMFRVNRQKKVASSLSPSDHYHVAVGRVGVK